MLRLIGHLYRMKRDCDERKIGGVDRTSLRTRNFELTLRLLKKRDPSRESAVRAWREDCLPIKRGQQSVIKFTTKAITNIRDACELSPIVSRAKSLRECRDTGT